MISYKTHTKKIDNAFQIQSFLLWNILQAGMTAIKIYICTNPKVGMIQG